jgi:hypothetical protein
MRLLVRKGDHTTSEFRFEKGPVYIGRRSSNHVCLPERTVSKQHAVIFATNDGNWTIEDLESANKTYLNESAVHKAPIKTGDSIRIADFTIDVDFEEEAADETGDEDTGQLGDTLHLEATLTTPPHEIIVRKPDAGHAPAMRLPAKRLTDFSQAAEAVCKADRLDELVQTLLSTILKQFDAFHSWCALREQPTGPMNYQAGKRRDGQGVELEDLQLRDKIEKAIEKGQFLVLPRVAAQVEEKQRIRSAMVATIIRPNGCYGALYVDNAMVHEHYSLSDLDYLMLLAMHTAAVLRRLLGL